MSTIDPRNEIEPSNTNIPEAVSSVALVWRMAQNGHVRIQLEENHVDQTMKSSDPSSIITTSYSVSPRNGRGDEDVCPVTRDIESKPEEALRSEDDAANDNEATDDDHNNKPETVLQYERQRRKAQHAKRVGTPILAHELHIVYEDNDIVVVSKPFGVLTVPGIHSRSSLLDAVHERYATSNNNTNRIVPAHMIVHRLDMDTSGLVVFGRSLDITKRLQQNFRDRDGVHKEYRALVMGHVPSDISSGIINLPIQRDHAHPPFMRVATTQSEGEAQQALKDLHHYGYKKLIRLKPKPSVTEFHVLQRLFHPQYQLPCTLLQLKPITGRTHQLRVHCAALGYPIVGDPPYSWHGEASPYGGLLYVPSVLVQDDNRHTIDHTIPNADRPATKLERCSEAFQQQWTSQYPPNARPMCLHAMKLGLQHPTTGECMTFHAAPPF